MPPVHDCDALVDEYREALENYSRTGKRADLRLARDKYDEITAYRLMGGQPGVIPIPTTRP